MTWRDYVDGGLAVSFSHPDTWQISEGESLQLVSPSGSAITWSTMTAPFDAGDAVSASEQALEGEMPGRSWIISRRNVMMMVTYFAGPGVMSDEKDAGEKEVVDQIIASAVPAPDLPADAQALRQEVYEHLQDALPDVIIQADGLSLTVGDGAVLNLANIYREIRAMPEQRATRIAQMVEGVRQMQLLGEQLNDWEWAKGRLFPLLTPNSFEDPGRIKRPVNDVISVVYSVDAGPMAARVTQAQLDPWKVSAEVVDAHAFENLGKRHPLKLVPAQREGVPLALLDPHTFATGQVMLPGFLEQAQKLLGPRVVVAMPTRDVVYAAAESSASRLVDFVAADHGTLPFALLTELFVCTPGRLDLFVPKGLFSRLFGRA
jgi:hypothetical protein